MLRIHPVEPFNKIILHCFLCCLNSLFIPMSLLQYIEAFCCAFCLNTLLICKWFDKLVINSYNFLIPLLRKICVNINDQNTYSTIINKSQISKISVLNNAIAHEINTLA